MVTVWCYKVQIYKPYFSVFIPTMLNLTLHVVIAILVAHQTKNNHPEVRRIIAV